MEIQTVIIAVLAAWRITSAINREKVGAPIRRWLANEKPDSTGFNFTYSDTVLSKLVTCFMCLSFWAAVFCVVIAHIYPLFLYPFAISTLVIFVEEGYQHGAN